ncbi:hypothetical protein YPPY14_1735, partial [Yersinia pestis PY-14]
MIHDIY